MTDIPVAALKQYEAGVTLINERAVSEAVAHALGATIDQLRRPGFVDSLKRNRLSIDQKNVFVAALMARGAKKCCPSCDANAWSGIEMIYVPIAGSDNRWTQLLIAACNNCGFVRMHHPSVLWPAPGSKGIEERAGPGPHGT